jgi:hypothetical protein
MAEGIRPQGDLVVRGGLEGLQFFCSEKELHRHWIIFQLEKIPQTENDVGATESAAGIFCVIKKFPGKPDVIHENFGIHHTPCSFF